MTSSATRPPGRAAEPGTLSLFPGAEGTTTVFFRPPRAAETPTGELPFGVRAKSQEDPAGSAVEEGVLVVGSYQDAFAELVPRTSRGSRGATHELAVDNRGNSRLNATVTAGDQDQLLGFDVQPPGLVVDPGTAGFAKIRVKPRQRFWRGQPKTRPFKVAVQGEGGPPILLDGSLLQEAVLPRWLIPALLAALAALIALVVIWLMFLQPAIKSAATAALEDAGITPLPTQGGGGGGGEGGGQARRHARPPLPRRRPTATPPPAETPPRRAAPPSAAPPSAAPARPCPVDGRLAVDGSSQPQHEVRPGLLPDRPRLRQPEWPGGHVEAHPGRVRADHPPARELPGSRLSLRDADRGPEGPGPGVEGVMFVRLVRSIRLLLRLPRALSASPGSGPRLAPGRGVAGPRRVGAVVAVAVMVVATPALATVSNPTPGPSPVRAAVRPGQPTAAPPAAPVAISLETPGTNERVSVADDESQLAGLEADQAAVTPDGRFVVFRAGLAGVGFAQQNDRILLRDRVAGTTTQIYPPERFSIEGGPPKPPVIAEEPTISADGNMVAFTLTPGRAAAPRLILWRRGIGLSYPLADEDLRGDGFAASSFARASSLHPRLSADGGVLVFLAKPYGDFAANLVDGYYALTFSTRLIEAVSAKTDQTDPFPGPVEFGTAAVSADGNLVAFSSSHDFFYLPILSDFTPILSDFTFNSDFGGYFASFPSPSPGINRSPEGGTSDGPSDGQIIVSVPRPKQIWLRNRLTRTTTLISSTPAVPGAVGDVPGAGDSDHPAMSADGRVIAFDSLAPDLVSGDTNETTDVFVRAEPPRSAVCRCRPAAARPTTPAPGRPSPPMGG